MWYPQEIHDVSDMEMLLVAQFLCLMANGAVSRLIGRAVIPQGRMACMGYALLAIPLFCQLRLSHIIPTITSRAVYRLPCHFQDQRPDQELGFLHARPRHEVGKFIARRGR